MTLIRLEDSLTPEERRRRADQHLKSSVAKMSDALAGQAEAVDEYRKTSRRLKKAIEELSESVDDYRRALDRVQKRNGGLRSASIRLRKIITAAEANNTGPATIRRAIAAA